MVCWETIVLWRNNSIKKRLSDPLILNHNLTKKKQINLSMLNFYRTIFCRNLKSSKLNFKNMLNYFSLKIQIRFSKIFKKLKFLKSLNLVFLLKNWNLNMIYYQIQVFRIPMKIVLKLIEVYRRDTIIMNPQI